MNKQINKQLQFKLGIENLLNSMCEETEMWIKTLRWTKIDIIAILWFNHKDGFKIIFIMWILPLLI